MEKRIIPITEASVARYEQIYLDIYVKFLRSEDHLKENFILKITEETILRAITRYKEYIETLHQNIDAMTLEMSLGFDMLNFRYSATRSKPNVSDYEVWELFSLARTSNHAYYLYAAIYRLLDLIDSAITTHKCALHIEESDESVNSHPERYYLENPATDILTWCRSKLS